MLQNGGDVNNTLFGLIVSWSDGFVSNWVRQKDNNVWIMTVTICPPAHGKKGNKYSTDSHVVVMGLSKHCHGKVVSVTLDEIAELEKGVMRLMYQDGRPKLVNVSLTIVSSVTVSILGCSCSLLVLTLHLSSTKLAFVSDKLERNALTSTLGCTGNTSKRGLYAALFKQHLVPSCSQCNAARVRRVLFGDTTSLADTNCRLCCDWDYDSERGAWEQVWPVGDGFPTQTIDDDILLAVGVAWPSHRKIPIGTYIKPVKQSFPWMISGVRIALLAYAIGAWPTLKQVRMYLLSFAISSKNVIDVVESFAKHLKKEVKAISNQADRISYLQGELQIENLVERGVIPHMWDQDSIVIDMFLEEPMHGLFLGVNGTIYDVMEQFMAKQANKAGFERHINRYLFDIRDFKVSFCRVREFPKAMWISENHVATSRLIRFIYGHYFSVITVKDNSAVEAAMRMVTSFDVMVSQLMFDGDDDEIDLELTRDVVKLFLSCCVEFATHLSQSGNCEFLEKANFLSLLNLVDQVIQYGSLRKWWGGSFESDIGKIKSELKFLRKSQSFLATKLAATRKAFYHTKISNQWFGKKDEVENRTKKQTFDAHRADSIASIISRFNEGDVISVFRLKDSKSWFASFGRDKLVLRVVRFFLPDNSISHEVLGTNYHRFELDPHCYAPDRSEIDANITEFGLMLPIPPGLVEATGFYSIVTNKWTSLDSEGNTSLPKLPVSLFGSMLPPESLESLVGRHIAVLYQYIDEKTSETGLDWYCGEILAYDKRRKHLQIMWEDGDTDCIRLNLDKYGDIHEEGGWKIIQK